MRRLQWFVLGESTLAIALGVVWWNSDGVGGSLAAPPAARDGRSAGERTTGAPAAAETQAEVDAAAASRTAETRRTTADPGGTAPYIVLRGRVLVDDGSPIAEGSNVSLSARRGNTWRSATVVSSGEYAVPALLPGDWEIGIRSDEFVRQTLPVTIDLEPVQTRDFVLTRAQRVEVFLRTPDGKQLAAEANAVDWQPGRSLTVIAVERPLEGDLPPTEHSTIGELGIGRYRSHWELSGRKPPTSGEPDGVLMLDRAPPATATLLLRHVVLQQQAIAPGQQQVTFTLDRDQLKARTGTVRLRIVDGLGGQPIADVMVSLSTAQGGGGGGKSAADGTFVGNNLLPGDGWLSLTAKGREHVHTMVRVPAGGDVDLGEFRLHAPLAVRGTLLDAAGKPVSGSVSWTDLDRMPSPPQLVTNRSTMVNGDGEFAIGSLGPRRVVAVASNPEDGMGHAVIDTRNGVAVPVVIRLQPTVDMEIVARGDPLVGYAVALLVAEGVPVATGRIGPTWRSLQWRVPAGDYTLELYGADARLLRREPLAVRAGTIVEVP